MAQQSPAKAENQALEKAPARELTISERFMVDVQKQFEAQMGGGLQFTALERRLTQHMFLKVDQVMKGLEAKRQGGNMPYEWKKVDRQKLALDTVHRVSLGLDALIPNHIHPVFYRNSHTGLFDVDLQIGYVGLDYIARKFAVEPPVEIIYELVYSTDKFRALMRSAAKEVEDYEFDITSPFDRGEVQGGFGYIIHENPKKNRLILVTPRDFSRAKGAAKSDKFWNGHDLEMLYKTVVRRVASKIRLDTEKVNAAALAAVTADEYAAEDRAAEEVAVQAQATANRQLVDVEAPPQASAKTIDAEEAGAAADVAEAELEQMAEDGGAFNDPTPEIEPSDDAEGLFPDADF